MKKFAKSLVVATALAVTLSTAAAGTAEAAAKKGSVTVTNKTVKSKKVTLTAGKKLQLAVKVNGKKVKTKKLSKKVTFKTSKKKVATVSASGKIKAVKKGTAKITITSKATKTYKKAKYVLKVTVKAKTAATTATPTTAAPTTEAPKTEAPTTAAPATQAPATEAPKTEAPTTAAPTTEAPKTEEPTTAEPTTQEPVAEKKTVVTAKDAKSVEAEVEFDDVTKVQKDVDDLAAMSTAKKGSTFAVELNGTSYTATYDGKNVKIGNSLISESEVAKEAAKKAVKVKVEIKADKIAHLTAFAPESVKSVKFGDVTFTDITKDSFKIDGKDYKYTVDADSNIVVDGDASEALAALETVATIEVK